MIVTRAIYDNMIKVLIPQLSIIAQIDVEDAKPANLRKITTGYIADYYCRESGSKHLIVSTKHLTSDQINAFGVLAYDAIILEYNISKKYGHEETVQLDNHAIKAFTIEWNNSGMDEQIVDLSDGLLEIKNWYIKDTGDGMMYMSGMAIPRDEQKITKNINFVDCDFHPSSYSYFKNCKINGTWIPDGPGCLYDYERMTIDTQNKVRVERGQPILVWNDKTKWAPASTLQEA